MRSIKALEVEYKKETDLSKKIELLAQIADYSAIQHNWHGYEFTLTHIRWLYKNKKLSQEQKAILHYFEAITWGDISREDFSTAPSDLHIINKDTTQAEYLERQLFLYRKALLYRDILLKFPSVRSAQLLTNFANLYSQTGRSIEALELWEKALQIVPDFTMAKGNLAIELKYLASLFYTNIDKYAFTHRAFINFRDLKKDIYTTEEAWEQFLSEKKDLDPYKLEDDDGIRWNSPKSRSLKEFEYRAWALRNKLFLNPLNNLEQKPLCAQDPLLLPSIITDIKVGPIFHGMFNELKQQYTSARFILYEGIESNKTHFADKRVTITNTWDYVSSNLNTEKVKLAYRSLFSIFDKVSFFLNNYYSLSIDPSSSKLTEQVMNKLPKIYDCNKNHPLSGISWLLKDIYEESYKKYLDNDTKLIREIRNQIEHKYLKVTDYNITTGKLSKPDSFLADEMAYYVSRSEFNDKALKLLKLSRSLLIYLLLAIKRDQDIKNLRRDSKEIIPPIFIDNIEDAWKR